MKSFGLTLSKKKKAQLRVASSAASASSTPASASASTSIRPGALAPGSGSDDGHGTSRVDDLGNRDGVASDRACASEPNHGGGGDLGAKASARRIINEQIKRAGQRREELANRVRQEALAQDASAFDYDGVYDAIQEKREREAAAKKAASSRTDSVHIEALKASAKRREMERERALEKKLRREREAEEAEFGRPTETFVTQGYKAKLEERRRWEEDEEKEAGHAGKEGDFYSAYVAQVSSSAAGDGAFSSAAAEDTSGGVKAGAERAPFEEPRTARHAYKAREDSSATATATSPPASAQQVTVPSAASAANMSTSAASGGNPPSVSQDDIIAAARARALARKRQREA